MSTKDSFFSQQLHEKNCSKSLLDIEGEYKSVFGIYENMN